jgi:hypothetical protein
MKDTTRRRESGRRTRWVATRNEIDTDYVGTVLKSYVHATSSRLSRKKAQRVLLEYSFVVVLVPVTRGLPLVLKLDVDGEFLARCPARAGLQAVPGHIAIQREEACQRRGESLGKRVVGDGLDPATLTQPLVSFAVLLYAFDHLCLRQNWVLCPCCPQSGGRGALGVGRSAALQVFEDIVHEMRIDDTLTSPAI